MLPKEKTTHKRLIDNFCWCCFCCCCCCCFCCLFVCLPGACLNVVVLSHSLQLRQFILLTKQAASTATKTKPQKAIQFSQNKKKIGERTLIEGLTGHKPAAFASWPFPLYGYACLLNFPTNEWTSSSHFTFQKLPKLIGIYNMRLQFLALFFSRNTSALSLFAAFPVVAAAICPLVLPHGRSHKSLTRLSTQHCHDVCHS